MSRAGEVHILGLSLSSQVTCGDKATPASFLILGLLICEAEGYSHLPEHHGSGEMHLIKQHIEGFQTSASSSLCSPPLL